MGDEPLILAIETSADVCGVAVARGGVLLSAHTLRHRMHLSERLLDHVDAVLRDADADLRAVDAFAVGIGPGSFTGVRIGVMTAKTLADIQAKPLYGVRSLEAIASRYVGLPDTVVTVILPCRAETVFCGFFDVTGDINPLGEPEMLPLDEVIVRAHGLNHVLMCGQAASRFSDRLSKAGLAIGSTDDPSAVEIARLAWTRIQAGDAGDDSFALVPLYMAPPPITMPKDRRGLVPAPAGESGG
jgi:tRNA threonylcarbamoyladenosine biosynthesis protein TsaB